jgi:hypothetical protein
MIFREKGKERLRWDVVEEVIECKHCKSMPIISKVGLNKWEIKCPLDSDHGHYKGSSREGCLREWQTSHS